MPFISIDMAEKKKWYYAGVFTLIIIFIITMMIEFKYILLQQKTSGSIGNSSTFIARIEQVL